MGANNYYEALGLDKKASAQDIKKAYKKLAKKWHPDVNKAPEAEKRFKEAAEAYEVLGNEEKRKAYDEEQHRGFGRGKVNGTGGASWEAPFGAGAGGGWSRSYSTRGAGIPDDDLFGMFFGSRGAADRAGFDFAGASGGTAPGGSPWGETRSTMQAQMEITLEQAYKGGSVRVQVGSRDVNVSIPARVQDGTMITVPGGGGTGDRGGDLLIVLHILPHEVYELQDGDLHGILQIAPWQAVLGGDATVSLPDGSAVKLKIPAGIRSGKTLRIPGKGLKRGNGTYGNILFDIEIIIPEPVSETERALYRQLADSGSFRAGTKTRNPAMQRRKAPMG